MPKGTRSLWKARWELPALEERKRGCTRHTHTHTHRYTASIPWVSPCNGPGRVGPRPCLRFWLPRFFALPFGRVSCRSREPGRGQAAQLAQGLFRESVAWQLDVERDRSPYSCHPPILVQSVGATEKCLLSLPHDLSSNI